jgi:hypothetical protein
MKISNIIKPCYIFSSDAFFLAGKGNTINSDAGTKTPDENGL